jgi:hypothetical protein
MPMFTKPDGGFRVSEFGRVYAAYGSIFITLAGVWSLTGSGRIAGRAFPGASNGQGAAHANPNASFGIATAISHNFSGGGGCDISC